LKPDKSDTKDLPNIRHYRVGSAVVEAWGDTTVGGGEPISETDYDARAGEAFKPGKEAK
jgi:hypothetical protein